MTTIPDRVREAIADRWLDAHDHADSFEEIDEQDRQWRKAHGLSEDGGKPHKDVVVANFLWDAGLEDWLALLAYCADRASTDDRTVVYDVNLSNYYTGVDNAPWEDWNVLVWESAGPDNIFKESGPGDLTMAVVAAIGAIEAIMEYREGHVI